ncbi:MAG: GGDEF domain-containing protein [Desulfuromonadaceae bacterium]|nr:GGDEF domain-containing protein [Desulfuromonadaceae bacterium]MDD2854672.1 GGDEF domain-containing protein [Desulfuromonadaceae bacterium]
MTEQSASSRNAAGVHDSHFEHLIAGCSHDSNPLMIEYRLLYEEYSALKNRARLLDRENQSLKTQLTEMDRSLDLATRIDPMTGLPNRRDIMEKMERELSRAQRHLRTFSVMLLDLDNFKQLNETHGYNDGDDVLVEVARVLMSCVRNEDVCARWGGEEFLFLLTETSIDGAITLARKILESISMTEFKANHPGIRITASIGISEYRVEQSLSECVNQADKALRQAKLGGKNRFMIAP